MKRDEAMKLVENGIAALNDALRAGHSETLERFLESLARFHTYSFNNALLIALQRPDATRVAGFHAWRKLGRFVKKGEHGIAIFAPMSRRKSRDERQQSMTEGEQAIFGFRIAHVFDVEQTEGDPLPEFARLSGDAKGWLAHLENTVRDAGVDLEYGHIGFPIGAKGISTPGAIKVSPRLSEPEKFAVLVHEFAHELLHQRTDRKQHTTRQIRETEAEAVAYTVCRAFGIDSTTRSSDYIQLYRGNEETLTESLKFVQHTAAQIIELLQRRSEEPSEAKATILAA
jgi:antirestriction protein ArdC